MRYPKSVHRVVIAATVLLVAGACGGGRTDGAKSASGNDVVKVGVLPIVDVAPIYLGKEKGFFSKRKIDLVLEAAQTGQAQGVASGQYQFAFANLTTTLVAASKGIGIKFVAPGMFSTGQAGQDYSAVVVPPGSPITRPADLAGKKVAINSLGSIGSATISKAVTDDGGDAKSVHYVELAFADVPGALANKRVDAAWVVEPFLTITTAQGAKPVAWNLATAADDLMVSSYFTSQRLAGTDPGLVQRFTEAIDESLDYAAAHPDEIRSQLSTYTKIDSATSQKITLPRFSTAFDRDSVELLTGLAVAEGSITKKPDLDAMMP